LPEVPCKSDRKVPDICYSGVDITVCPAAFQALDFSATAATMMDPAVKTALALCVIAAGTCAALLFRHDRPCRSPPTPTSQQQLLLRYGIDASTLTRQPGTAGRLPAAARRSVDRRQPIVVTPLDRNEPPPSLPRDFPQSDCPVCSPWGASMDMRLRGDAPAEETARTHTVVDGDTLAALADRYLGSSAWAGEIYEANRDVLRDPELLPIGAELKLPPRVRQSAPAPRPLVPVRH
jgi:hypothetical protein